MSPNPDRRILLADPFRKPRPDTVGVAKGDPEVLRRNQGSEHRDLQLVFGNVQCVIPSLGWHRVELENGGIVAASSADGYTDVWGTQSGRVYQAGSQVVLAVQSDTYLATIVGQMPSRVGSHKDFYSQPTYVGSWTSYRHDPMARFYVESLDEAGGAYGYRQGQSADQHQGDYSVRGSLGSLLLVDAFQARLAVDEATGLTLGLLDQFAALTGRDLLIQGDGLVLTGDRRTKTSRLGLGGSQLQRIEVKKDQTSRARSLEIAPAEILWKPEEATSAEEFFQQVTAASIGFEPWPVETETRDSELYYTLLTLSTPEQLYELGLGQRSRYALGGETTLGSLHWVSLPDVVMLPKNLAAEKLSAAIPEADKLVDQASLAAWQSAAQVHAPLLDSGLQLAEQFYEFHRAPSLLDEITPLKLFAAETSPSSAELIAALAFGDSAAYASRVPLGAEPPAKERGSRHDLFSEHLLPNVADVKSVLKTDDAGNIFLYNEAGAGLAIIGGKLYLNALSIHIVSAKDIELMARDVHVLANRDAVITANKSMRIFSGGNFEVLAGNSGAGGLLLESRGSEGLNFPDDPRNKQLAGVLIKSKAPIAALGGDIVLQAGETLIGGSGTLLLNNKSGDVVVSAAARVITHAAAEQLQSFGYSWTSPAQVIAHYGSQSLFPGAVFGQDLWSAGAVTAVSNITTAYGQVGKSAAPGEITRGVQQMGEQITSARSEWRSEAQVIRNRLTQSGGVLSEQVIRKASASFAAGEEADKDWYGMHWRPSAPFATLFQLKRGGQWEDFSQMEVVYQPDESARLTRAWPGSVSSEPIDVPRDDITTRGQLDKLLSKSSFSSSTDKLSFPEVFRTFKGP